MEKKIAFISGAAGGLGKATVSALLDENFKVIATDLDIAGLKEYENRKDLDVHSLDVTDPKAIRDLMAKLRLDETGLDLLVGLAGIYDVFPVTDTDPEDFNRIIKVNFLGNSNLIAILVKSLVMRGGRVVVVSSESYKMQAVFQPYLVSKAALELFCRTAWQELRLKNVWLSVIRPGAIDTPLLDWMKKDDLITGSIYKEEIATSFAQSKKMVGKVTSPEKVAGIILKAATDRKPKRFYLVNNNPLLSLIALLPSRLLDRLIVRKFKR